MAVRGEETQEKEDWKNQREAHQGDGTQCKAYSASKGWSEQSNLISPFLDQALREINQTVNHVRAITYRQNI